ncbi:hypothetical protein EX30DRAFT_360359 [Ascodesmis nigricans]|uniref:Fatty acid hydroxylase domain-containing protein n=1 Tax=Ascodesmis nigricans TaxID=341454 RepID=A0A4S2MIJ6_9PEZI|nr:hypothetical protein EX30DRAFT_360359 [Ascodesmis nigricans]
MDGPTSPTNNTLPTTSSLPTNLLQQTWSHIYHTYTPAQIELTITLLNPLLTFWLAGFVLTYLLPSPPFTKFQPASRQPSQPKILRAALYSLRNQLVVHGLQGLELFFPIPSFGPLGKLVRKPRFRIEEELPAVGEVVWQVAVALVIREVLFYYSHRVFHWRGVYRWVHKMHHEYVTPVAWSAQYCTVLEHIVANVLPILIPGIVLRMHILTFSLWAGSQSLQATIDHAGWNTWLWWQARSHDRHHELFKVNFGTNGLLDWLHGTQDKVPRNKVMGDAEVGEKMHYD